ncbi:hypothetical protein OE88DRAFT_756687 [Heliocybe sulcata]|uniref:Uncharacterized protein n=1 Tax=Heliocybe sulcata TaxID=5364 RepID=A0A5C3MSW2_9AGAM|nr:hypothetical protein OE88DRAFT_756687 [Heliocybe sulcata]
MFELYVLPLLPIDTATSVFADRAVPIPPHLRKVPELNTLVFVPLSADVKTIPILPPLMPTDSETRILASPSRDSNRANPTTS